MRVICDGPRPGVIVAAEEDEAVRKESGFRGPQDYRLPVRAYGYNDLKLLIQQRKTKMFTHHKSARFIKQNAGHAIWNNYFKFCFERNPIRPGHQSLSL